MKSVTRLKSLAQISVCPTKSGGRSTSPEEHQLREEKTGDVQGVIRQRHLGGGRSVPPSDRDIYGASEVNEQAGLAHICHALGALMKQKKASTDLSAEANRGNVSPQGTTAKRRGGESRLAVFAAQIGTLWPSFKAARRMAAMRSTHGRVVQNDHLRALVTRKSRKTPTRLEFFKAGG